MERDINEIRVLKDNGFFGSVMPVMVILTGTDAQSSTNYSTPFFIADRDYFVTGFRSRWETAAADGTVRLKKVTDGAAPSAGRDVTTAIPLTTAANTNVDSPLTPTTEDRLIKKGEALALEANGLLTTIQGYTGATYLKAV